MTNESSSSDLVLFSYASPFTDRLRAEERLFTFTCSPEKSDSKDSTVKVKIKQKWAPGRGGTDIGFGASVYDCSIVLSNYLADTDIVRGRSVLELGCGPGLVSVVCGMLGASTALATDGDDGSVDLASENISLNSVQDSVEAMKLLWGNEGQIARALGYFEGGEISYLLASDVAACPYEASYGPLVDTLRVLSGPTTTVILTYQKRHSSESVFFDTLSLYFFVERLDMDAIHQDFRHLPISLYRANLKH